MLNFEQTFETGNLIIRPMLPEDTAEFYTLTSDKEMWTYFTSDLSEKTTLSKWIDSAVQQIKDKTRLAFTIIDRKTGNIIGSTSIGSISQRDKRVEIGWTWLGKEFQGTGINSQVKYILLEYCFENLQLKRVEFKTDLLNTPARKALLKIGASEEGVLRSHTLMTGNRRRDTIFYSILKNEWPGIKENNYPNY